jgi:hypothetical protein
MRGEKATGGSEERRRQSCGRWGEEEAAVRHRGEGKGLRGGRGGVRREWARVCLFICASSIFSLRITKSTIYNDEGVLKWAGPRYCVGRCMHVCLGRDVGWASAVVFAVHARKDARQAFFAVCSNLAHGKLFFIIIIKSLKYQIDVEYYTKFTQTNLYCVWSIEKI